MGFLRSVVICSLLVGLSACGGSSTSLSPTGIYAQSLNNYITNATTLGFDGTAPSVQTPLAGVPTFGSADFSGQMALVVRADGHPGSISLGEANLRSQGIVGDVMLSADFALTGGFLAGSATNFRNADGSNVAGYLTIATTEINRISVLGVENVTYDETSIFGVLSNTRIGTAVIDGTVEGGFSDPGAVLWGTAKGTADPSAGTATFSGVFFAPEDP